MCVWWGVGRWGGGLSRSTIDEIAYEVHRIYDVCCCSGVGGGGG